MFAQLLDAGIAIAGIDVGESYGSVEGTAQYSALYDEMVRRGYSRKPVLLAQSRGGLMLYNWAVENPKRVTCIVGIYPVIDNRSYPGGENARRLADRNPILRLNTLHVPVFHIHGDSDKLVPLEANSGAMKKIYPNLTLKIVPGHGHEEIPEYFRDPDLVQFILRHLKTAR
jgi:pimeloyl-ACP methyl ester carboxylesterase